MTIIMPYKILYFHPSNELYGVDRALLRTIVSLDSQIYQPHVAIPNDIQYEGLLTDELRKHNITFQELKLGILRRRYKNVGGMVLFLQRILSSALRMARYCRKHEIKLLYSNSSAVITGGLVAKLTGIPHVWHVHEIITEPAWLNKLIAHILYQSSHIVVTVSNPVKDSLLSAQPQLAQKICVIHNGIDPTPFLHVDKLAVNRLKRSWDNSPDDIIIGMVGRISSWKGQEFLIKAVRSVIEQYPHVHVVLVGSCVPNESWRKNNLQQLIADYHLQNHVHIEDFRMDIPVVLSAFDIFVLPSTRPDPFPTVVLEGMAAGKPVVATRHGGAIEQVKHGKTGLLVSPTDIHEMTTALNQLVAEQSMRQEMGKSGRKRLLELFTVGQYVKNIESLYQSILS